MEINVILDLNALLQFMVGMKTISTFCGSYHRIIRGRTPY